MKVLERLEKVMAKMSDLKANAFYITNVKNVRYLTGFTGDESALLILGKKAYFLTDSRFTQQAKTQLPKEIEIVLWQGSNMKEAQKRINTFQAEKVLFEGGNLTYLEGAAFVSGVSGNCVDAKGLIENLRVIKDETEIQYIKTACKIVDETFSHMLNFIQIGMTEKEIGAELEYHMKKLGAEGPSFETIIASGVRSSFPHGTATDKKIASGDLITLDFGALYEGYASDMTRTIGVGKVDPRLEQAYYQVLEAEENGLKGITANQTCHELDTIVRKSLIAANMNQYFTHGTGHSIGLDIHENPIIRTNSNDLILENMIMTIEPGIYLPDLGGIRIEDDVLVTTGVGEVLTKAPKKELILL